MREMARICLVAPKAVVLTREKLRTVPSPLMRMVAPNREFEPEDVELDDAGRKARTVRRHGQLRPEQLPAAIRRVIRRTTPDGRLPIWVQMHPWQRVAGTGMEQLGILIDIVFRPEDIEIAAVEADFTARLAKRARQSGKGREVDTWEDDVGLWFVTRSQIITPAIVYPVHEPPKVAPEAAGFMEVPRGPGP